MSGDAEDQFWLSVVSIAIWPLTDALYGGVNTATAVEECR
jgi:hypothetical protein